MRQQAELQQQVEAAAEAARIPRHKLLAAAQKEYELSGDIGPVLADLPATARVLGVDPNTAGADLGAVRAQFKSFGLDTPEQRERAMSQMVLSAAAGSLAVADLARGAGEAMATQTEIFGNRNWETFLEMSQRVMTGYMKAEPALTAQAQFQKVLSLEREALTALIGQVDPETTSPVDIAARIMAAVGGDVARLKGTPFGTQETLGALAGLTGAKGQDVGQLVTDAIRGSAAELRARIDPDWIRQTETPAAQVDLAQDLAQRDSGATSCSGICTAGDHWRSRDIFHRSNSPQVS